MGDRRGEGEDRAEKGGAFKVRPSSLRTYVYCPRLYFFTVHLGRKPGLLERLRMALGRVYHLILGYIDRLRGYRVEEPIEVEVGGFRFVGRPDSWRLDNGSLLVVERKSGRAPEEGVWLADLAQATAYAFIISRSGVGVERAYVQLEYARGGARRVAVGEDLVSMVLRASGEMMLVHSGVVPYPNRSPGKCGRCPFRAVCEALDRELEPPEGGEVFEPGSWVGDMGNVYRT